MILLDEVPDLVAARLQLPAAVHVGQGGKMPEPDTPTASGGNSMP